MMIAAIKFKWDGFRRKFLNGHNKRRNDQLIRINSAHERSISILQKRYGYTREQAAYEFNKHYSKAWLG
ncbi:MAG TPA: hypothetical protein VMN99_00690 [Anaerolineales bacterium]|nr:hypothetical protein [Anaerolineales bacterium]